MYDLSFARRIYFRERRVGAFLIEPMAAYKGTYTEKLHLNFGQMPTDALVLLLEQKCI